MKQYKSIHRFFLYSFVRKKLNIVILQKNKMGNAADPFNMFIFCHAYKVLILCVTPAYMNDLLVPPLHAPQKTAKVALWYPFPFFHESICELKECLWWSGTPTNPSIHPHVLNWFKSGLFAGQSIIQISSLMRTPLALSYIRINLFHMQQVLCDSL